MIDDRLTMQVYQLFSQFLSVVGTLGLVLYAYALLGIIFIPIIFIYIILAGFYRQSSREIKRIDSNQRSYIYSSFGEQLIGLPSIRAYRQQQHFRTKLQAATDVECRAYAMTIYIQRWLGIRLDFLGNCLILGICLFGVGFATSVSPAKLGGKSLLSFALLSFPFTANKHSHFDVRSHRHASFQSNCQLLCPS